MTHFIMMGMNPDTEGVYSLNDCEYSASFQNEKERKNFEYQQSKYIHTDNNRTSKKKEILFQSESIWTV